MTYTNTTCPVCGTLMMYSSNISQNVYCPRCAMGGQTNLQQQRILNNPMKLWDAYTDAQKEELRKLFTPQSPYKFPVQPAIEHGHETTCSKHGLQGVTIYGGCVVCSHSYDGYREQFADWLKRTTCRCKTCLVQMHHGVEALERMALQEEPAKKPIGALMDWSAQAKKVVDP